MKRVFLSLAVIAMIGLASCSKEKTCECTSSSDIPMSTDVVSEQIIEDGDCEDLDIETTSLGFTTSFKCVEK